MRSLLLASLPHLEPVQKRPKLTQKLRPVHTQVMERHCELRLLVPVQVRLRQSLPECLAAVRSEASALELLLQKEQLVQHVLEADELPAEPEQAVVAPMELPMRWQHRQSEPHVQTFLERPQELQVRVVDCLPEQVQPRPEELKRLE